ncbi:hypothetical protein [Roseibium marinum]|uniref:Uncharacterized protein n=1 Tax=Roseibium marinum TaxID=281252 RepID=A0A2S3V421_9HYPH|nr:hypothetical protein [Roseibium marinum]POF34711.1 hypothetical protein CLV41_1011169 [Roseibium marinum]
MAGIDFVIFDMDQVLYGYDHRTRLALLHQLGEITLRRRLEGLPA